MGEGNQMDLIPSSKFYYKASFNLHYVYKDI